MTKKETFIDKLTAFAGSRKFFLAIVAFFIFESLWVALSNRYPMAFDENVHLGAIKLYAEHMSPFWTAQPDGANAFGAFFRDPSYLYHFLFGWIYNFIDLFTNSQTVQVIIMRIMNVGIFVWAFFIYRKLLGAMGVSSVATNVLLLIFALIPVSSLLAGQINYDNLLIPFVGLLMLWTIQFVGKLKATQKVDSELLLKIAALGLIGSVVKYAYLPFFVAALIYMVLSWTWVYGFKIRAFGNDLLESFNAIRPKKKWILLSFVAVGLILSFERYGLNVIKYGSPVPDCGVVMSYNECKEFGPWIRDYNLAQRDLDFTPEPFKYFYKDWLYGMWFRLFFMVDGPDTNFQTRGPLTVPSFTFIGLVVASVILSIVMAKRLWFRYGYKIGIPLFISFFYALVLWSNGFSSFAETGKPVAINGRYLLLIILPVLAVGAISFSLIFKKNDRFKVVLVSALLICFLWGGGILTFILRSNDAWYWDNSAVKNVNTNVREAVGPVVPGYEKPTQYQR